MQEDGIEDEEEAIREYITNLTEQINYLKSKL